MKTLFLSNANTIELHYWLANDEHTMDAVLQNKCEAELLHIIENIATIFECKITIETEPLAEGGIKRWFKVVAKIEDKKAIITTAIITVIASALLSTPIEVGIKALGEHIFNDKEIQNLQKEETKANIENLKADTEFKLLIIDEKKEIKKRKSNFYKNLQAVSNLDKVSINAQNNEKLNIIEEEFINKENFDDYIIINDELDPIYIENALIEIISPVLKKGNYKWRGIYEGESIMFDMRSNEFKTLVQTGHIEFKNGSSIKCLLELERFLDENGKEKIKNHKILRVDEYFENDKPIETSEGRKNRQVKDAERRQLSFLDRIE